MSLFIFVVLFAKTVGAKMYQQALELLQEKYTMTTSLLKAVEVQGKNFYQYLGR